MNAKKSALQEALEAAGAQCRSYSGRGMYGKTCLGVDERMADFLACLVRAVREAPEENLDDIEDQVRGVRTDSMGMGMIVYFLDVPYVGDEGGEEE